MTSASDSPDVSRWMQKLGITDFPPEGSRSLEAWLLGPKCENAEILEQLVLEAIRDQTFWRRNFHPGDPSHITEQMKASPDYVESMGLLKESYRDLLGFLKKSVPFFSMRYQGHMNWDLTIPSILGYFATMLYNPNNVAFEGSAATTLLELVVGNDLCRMLGYELKADPAAIRPWGHITCDGTVANIEAIWAARNLKLYPLALAEALRTDPRLVAARGLEVPLPDGRRGALIDLDTWTKLNLRGDDILRLAPRIEREFEISVRTVGEATNRFSVQHLGMAEFTRRFLADVPLSARLFVPGSKHYSFPKTAAVLGLGSHNVVDIGTDLDARQDAVELRRELQRCLDEKRPVYAVVAVMGSTEESSIDPLRRILELREEFRKQGLEFVVHADAAWGGYHRSVMNDEFAMDPPGKQPPPDAAPPPALPMSEYVQAQFKALGHADSITVDPHKSGYIPYPAGALCYRNELVRHLLTFDAPVIRGSGPEPTVGIYGIEGSKPGAAVAAVYLSHRVIRPTRSGYGKLIGQALFSCKRLYVRLLTLGDRQERFHCMPVARLPAERANGDVAAQLDFIRKRILHRSNDELRNDREAMDLLVELGPDQNIFAYAFNFKVGGVLNPDLDLANAFNRAVYERISIKPGNDIYGYDLIVSNGEIGPPYGPKLIASLKRRLGTGGSAGDTITILRSVVMDPWLTETTHGSFLDVLEREFVKALDAAYKQVVAPLSSRGY